MAFALIGTNARYIQLRLCQIAGVADGFHDIPGMFAWYLSHGGVNITAANIQELVAPLDGTPPLYNFDLVTEASRNAIEVLLAPVRADQLQMYLEQNRPHPAAMALLDQQERSSRDPDPAIGG